MSKDEIFRENLTTIADFNFGKKVVSVFDDMLDRSVPFYQEIQRMLVEMASEFAVEGTNIYDLGCSTGTTLLNLGQNIPGKVKFIGIDYSEDMLARCKQKLAEHPFSREHELTRADLNQGVHIENASVVVMVLTLQFIRPLNRDTLIGSILRGLNENGCLILVEKVLGEDSLFNRLFIKYYYDFKRRNGYSELEIAQKREALENVLIPYKLLENRELLIKEGFRYCDVFFKWYNFCGMIAVK
ncbi:carboxy-S-adenosyl-L-methionine synthase CmoA [Candidatus Brocadia sapporoensis]|uniref:Carboxy-S-adenosyl-L-methionine synthase n=1 Tax=Candidatus Brocadia sapporoensis TaxID=392547 RepID=A0A1V6M2L9_9BACT|nr:carboxy-S-adenosyl-L-methionine synthase CmoA [Candidatus Brocadia sapporoensis]MDG6005185.1 carboxy-S-adenosyl-L-methionine synthase CmoA [Candidatus Brocadia sp.]OQD46566.1 carboxy-S-adenosyl-L-methionine synthase CmoA [Candidatus Brocadia sapporoensis]OQD46571.1 carboxy-S-adenosyl-L-methionine synthase CmoA [Candidatus Brocadia sapporoensis]GJQ22549.1 MAG: carboxy-S-adenosyl-L-methionine synthase [Candidatus Brocadia sapporoensis]